MNRRFPADRTLRGGLAAIAAAVMAAALAPGLAAQSASDVVRTAAEKHQQRMEGVENYTLVQEAMGFETTTYFERTTVEGETVFVPRSVMGSEVGRSAPVNPYSSLRKWAEHATLEGTEQVDGEECHVVTIADFSGADPEFFGPSGESQDFTPERMEMWIDTDDHYLRRMRMQGSMTARGEANDVTFTAHLMDYREVEGVVHPFKTRVTAEGLGQQMSEEDQRKARESLQQMRERMADMPAQQREMMEKMMGGQMERLEKMLVSGALDVTLEVKEIRVNEGPPSGS